MWLIVILALMPLLWWWPLASFDFLSLGQITALIGYVLLCINFVLSARLRFVERLFLGLNKMYVVHHLVGGVAFVLLLIHPVLMLMVYFPIPIDLAVACGLAAFVIMCTVLVITFFVKMEYDQWKKIHKYMGLCLFFASLHMALIGSTVSQSLPLKIYMYMWTFLAMASFCYRVLLGRYLVPRRVFEVKKVNILNSEVVDVILNPINGRRMDFVPGQFVFVEGHPFSLTGKTGETEISFGVKAVGDFTKVLQKWPIGMKIKTEGPFGWFGRVNFPDFRQVWIAGGIGVTPFVSMAKNLDDKSRVDFYYAVTTKNEAVYDDVFGKIAAKNPNFHYWLHLSEQKGRLDIGRLGIDNKTEVFICGPMGMMKSYRIKLGEMGVRPSRIHTEEFSLN